MAYTYKYPRPAVTADCIVITREAEPKVLLIQRGAQPFKAGWAEWWPLSDFLDKPSGRSTSGRLLPKGRKKAERPHLAFDHYDIMQDAIQKYKEIVK